MRRLKILQDIDTGTCYIAEAFPSILTDEEELFIHLDNFADEDHARETIKAALDE